MEILPAEIWNMIMKFAQEPRFALCSGSCAIIWGTFNAFYPSSELLLEFCEKKDVRAVHQKNEQFFALQHTKICFSNGFILPWVRFGVPQFEEGKENYKKIYSLFPSQECFFYFRWLGRTGNREKYTLLLHRKELDPVFGVSLGCQKSLCDAYLFGVGEYMATNEPVLWEINRRIGHSDWSMGGFYFALQDKEKLMELLKYRLGKGYENFLDVVLYLAGKMGDKTAAKTILEQERSLDPRKWEMTRKDWDFNQLFWFTLGCYRSGHAEEFAKTMIEFSQVGGETEVSHTVGRVLSSIIHKSELTHNVEMLDIFL